MQTFGVFLFSLAAVPVSHYLSLQHTLTPRDLFLAAVGILCACLPAIYLVAGSARAAKRNVYFYVFALFAFTAVVDLLIAVTLQQWIPTLSFYLMKGEPYLKTPHGSFINLWDGTFHYALYLLMVHRISSGRSYRVLGLIWAGSIMNSMVVLLGGACTGSNSSHVQWSFFLNVPYAFLPVSHAWRTFASEHPLRAKLAAKRRAGRGFLLAVVDLVLAAGLVASCAVAFLRVFAAMGSELHYARWYARSVEPYLLSESRFPLWQMATYAFCFVPFYIKALVALWAPRGQAWLVDWSAFHLGAALQAQFSYALAAWYKPPGSAEANWQGVPADALPLFVAVNAGLVVWPFLLWLRCAVGRPTLFAGKAAP